MGRVVQDGMVGHGWMQVSIVQYIYCHVQYVDYCRVSFVRAW